MTKMIVEYTGELHCKITHEGSGAIIFTDAPKDNQGKGENFSPTDLIAASLASCVATVIGIYARRKGWNLSGMKLEVEKEMITDPVRRIGKLAVHVWMPISLSQEERQMVEKVAYTCPVHKTLHPDVEAKISFHWLE